MSANQSVQLKVPQTEAVPLSYQVPGAQLIQLQAVYGEFDGSGAAGSYLPAVEILSQDGLRMMLCPVSTQVAAGASANVTFGPFLGRGPGGAPAPGGASVIYDYTLPIAATALDTRTDGPDAGLFPAAFSVLEIWLTVRTDEQVGASPLGFRVNGDTSASYDRLFLSGFTNGSAPSGASTVGLTIGGSFWQPSAVCAAETGGSYFSLVRFTMPDYTSTVAYKTCESTHAHPDTKASVSVADPGLLIAPNVLGWRSTAAVTSFQVFPSNSGVHMIAGTRLTVVAL